MHQYFQGCSRGYELKEGWVLAYLSFLKVSHLGVNAVHWICGFSMTLLCPRNGTWHTCDPLNRRAGSKAHPPYEVFSCRHAEAMTAFYVIQGILSLKEHMCSWRCTL